MYLNVFGFLLLASRRGNCHVIFFYPKMRNETTKLLYEDERKKVISFVVFISSMIPLAAKSFNVFLTDRLNFTLNKICSMGFLT